VRSGTEELRSQRFRKCGGKHSRKEKDRPCHTFFPFIPEYGIGLSGLTCTSINQSPPRCSQDHTPCSMAQTSSVTLLRALPFVRSTFQLDLRKMYLTEVESPLDIRNCPCTNLSYYSVLSCLNFSSIRNFIHPASEVPRQHLRLSSVRKSPPNNQALSKALYRIFKPITSPVLFPQCSS
jgi:hypothetical protein